MNAGEVIKLTEELPYRKGEVYRTVLVNNDHMKFVVAVMDAGTSFPEQPTLGKAVIFALDGEAVIGYDKNEYRILAGEQFIMEKGVPHYVRADKPFKMAVVVDLL